MEEIELAENYTNWIGKRVIVHWVDGLELTGVLGHWDEKVVFLETNRLAADPGPLKTEHSPHSLVSSIELLD